MMRTLTYPDLCTLARALLAVESDRRLSLARHILDCAHYAETYRRKLNRAHPRWGNGSVDAAARSFPLAPASGFGNAEFCACFGVALSVCMANRRGKEA
jgi:hypothetical protein